MKTAIPIGVWLLYLWLNSIVLSLDVKKAGIGIVGAPFDKGQGRMGVAEGPKLIRASGFIKVLQESLKLDVKDYGDVKFEQISRKKRDSQSSGKLPKRSKEVGMGNQAISKAVSEVLKDGRIALTLGGDHSVAIGTIDAVSKAYPDLGVLWIDAHGDINTVETSNSGNMHGMPLSFLIQELEPYNPKLPEFSWLTPRIKAANLAYIGQRSIDDGERAIMDYYGIAVFGMREIDRLGILGAVRMALERISPGGTRPIHVSYDIDSLDTTTCNTTGTPQPGGLTLREASIVLEEVHATGRLVGFDLVEVNPWLGDEKEQAKTSEAVKNLLINAFGYCRSGISGNGVFPPSDILTGRGFPLGRN